MKKWWIVVTNKIDAFPWIKSMKWNIQAKIANVAKNFCKHFFLSLIASFSLTSLKGDYSKSLMKVKYLHQFFDNFTAQYFVRSTPLSYCWNPRSPSITHHLKFIKGEVSASAAFLKNNTRNTTSHYANWNRRLWIHSIRARNIRVGDFKLPTITLRVYTALSGSQIINQTTHLFRTLTTTFSSVESLLGKIVPTGALARKFSVGSSGTHQILSLTELRPIPLLHLHIAVVIDSWWKVSVLREIENIDWGGVDKVLDEIYCFLKLPESACNENTVDTF